MDYLFGNRPLQGQFYCLSASYVLQYTALLAELVLYDTDILFSIPLECISSLAPGKKAMSRLISPGNRWRRGGSLRVGFSRTFRTVHIAPPAGAVNQDLFPAAT